MLETSKAFMTMFHVEHLEASDGSTNVPRGTLKSTTGGAVTGTDLWPLTLLKFSTADRNAGCRFTVAGCCVQTFYLQTIKVRILIRHDNAFHSLARFSTGHIAIPDPPRPLV